MYDTKFIGKIYSPDLKIRQDYVFCLTILKKIKFAYGLNKPLAYRRLRSNFYQIINLEVLFINFMFIINMKNLTLLNPYFT